MSYLNKKLILNKTIKDNIINSITDNTIYLIIGFKDEEKDLISNENNIKGFDLLKIPDNKFTDDFYNLLKFSLPYGLCIVGIIKIFVLNNNNNSNKSQRLDLNNYDDTIEIFDSIYLKYINCLNETFDNSYNCNYLINNKLVILNVDLNDLIDKQKVVNVFENYKALNNNLNMFKRNNTIAIDCILFEDLSFYFYNNFIQFTIKDYEINMQLDNNYDLIVSNAYTMYKDNIHILLKDVNLLIDSQYTDDNFYNYIKNNESITKIFNENEVNLDLVYDSSMLLSYNKLNESVFDMLNPNSFKKQSNSLISIFKENTYINSNNSNTIKTCKFNVVFYISRNKFKINSNFFNNNLKSYLLFIINEIILLNSETSFTYSLHLFNKYNGLSYFILYSYKEILLKNQKYEEALYSQRKYFYNIHCINTTNDNFYLNRTLNNSAINFNCSSNLLTVSSLNNNYLDYVNECPNLKISQLEGYQYEKQYLINKEFDISFINNVLIYNNRKFVDKIINNKYKTKDNSFISPHVDLINNNDDYTDIIDSFKFIKGDYLFYYIEKGCSNFIINELNNNPLSCLINFYNLLSKEDKIIIAALLTVISFLHLNGHVSLDAYDKYKVILLMIYLGIISSDVYRLINSKKEICLNLKIDDIGTIVAYLIDVEIDIPRFKNKHDFSKNLDIITKHLEIFGTIIIMKINSKVLSIFGYNYCNKQFGVLDHSYNDKNSLLKLKYSNKCCILSMDDLICKDDSIEILLLKPYFSI